MSAQHACPCSDVCVLQKAMNAIGGKWKLPILCSLGANGASRYNDLLRHVRGISNTMLSRSLRELEEAGLVSRSEYLEVPVRVEYALTEAAEKLRPVLVQMIQWELSVLGNESDEKSYDA